MPMTQTVSEPLSVSSPPTKRAEALEWMDDEIDKVAASIDGTLSGIVNDAFSAYADTLTAAGDMAAFDNMGVQWSDYLVRELEPYWAAMYRESALNAALAADLPPAVAATTLPIWERLVNEAAVTYARNATNRLRGVGDAVWRAIRERVAKSLQLGLGTEALKAEIEQGIKDELDRVTSFSEFRADTIARTETVGAFVNGDRGGAEALGDYGPVEHYWDAHLDKRTRPSHRRADGQTKPWKEPFIVGGVAMLHPHARGAPPEEVVNCRCTEGFLYPGDTRPDGSKVPEAKGP